MKVEIGKELKFNNLLLCRRTLDNSEIPSVLVEMGKYISDYGVKRQGPLITKTNSVTADGKIDFSIYLSIDQEIISCESLVFVDELKIERTAYARHEGRPENVANSYEVMLDELKRQGIEPKDSGYNVNVNEQINNHDVDRFIMDLYIPI